MDLLTLPVFPGNDGNQAYPHGRTFESVVKIDFTAKNMQAAIDDEMYEYTEMVPPHV